jgi:hypothetical protein
MDRAEIVAAAQGEPFVKETSQFDLVLRRHEIQNVAYCGFAADMCILRASGGAEPMANFGCRYPSSRSAYA